MTSSKSPLAMGVSAPVGLPIEIDVAPALALAAPG
jgi:hypothetical protein